MSTMVTMKPLYMIEGELQAETAEGIMTIRAGEAI